MKNKTEASAFHRLFNRKIYGWTFIIILFFILVSFADKERSNVICSSVEIIIDENKPVHGFVCESNVLEMFHAPERNPIGKKLSDINIALLESMIRSNPYVLEAEVFSTVDGKVIFDIRQRLPIMRVINLQNEHFYIDSQGVFMPLSTEYVADVPVATGVPEVRFKHASLDLTAPPDSFSIIRHLYEISKFITRSEFWNAQTEQLHVNEQGDIELIPRLGEHVIILGNSFQLDEKFEHLMLLYRNGFMAKGWNQYTEINLKFSNQAVCSIN